MTTDRALSFVLALVAVAAAIANLAVFAHDYQLAPATVPTHFGVSGAPDAYGPRSTFVIFPALGGIFAAAAVAFWAFGPSVPQSQRVPPILPLLVILIFAETAWMLFFAEIGSFAVALGRAGGLGAGFFVGIALVMGTALVILIVSLLAARRMS